MTLAEAIRKGCETTVRCSGVYFIRGEDGTIVKSCALGAAMVARGQVSAVFDMLTKAYPELGKLVSIDDIPYRAFFSQTLHDVIVNMNDSWGYSREEIADWVEGYLASE